MENVEDHALQPFFVLHKALPKKSDHKTKSKTRRKIDLSTVSPKSSDKFQEQRSEWGTEDIYAQMRTEAFQIVWSKVEFTIKDVLQKMNVGLFDEIGSWIHSSFATLKSFGANRASDITRSYPAVADDICRQLHTALVITRNVESVDDLLTFEELRAHLKSYSFHVTNLSAQNFSEKNGICNCIRTLFRQLDILATDVADIAVIASWYRETQNYGRPIVLIIEDIEQCNNNVLAEFIIMLSEWILKIPIMLILGVATSSEALKRLLPSNALKCLDPREFFLGSPVDKMDAIIEAVLVKPCSALSFGHKVLLFLKNYFTRNDGTLTSFIRALKIACVKHFDNEPLSFLSQCMVDEDKQEYWKESFDSLSDTMLKHAFSFPSFQKEKGIEKAQTHCGFADGMENLKRRQNDMKSVLLCLCEAGKLLKIHLLGIVCEALNPDLYTENISDGVEIKMDTSTSHHQLDVYHFGLRKESIIAQVVHRIRDLPPATLGNLLGNWEKHTLNMDEIYPKVKEILSMLNSNDHIEKPNLADTRKTSTRLRAPYLMPTPTLNDKTSLLLRQMTRAYLIPTECIPFHEIICFKDVSLLQNALIADPRRTIQIDLLKSHAYLQCNCCGNEGNILSPSMHDTTIMYNLAQEHGDLINLHDWYQSFKSIIFNSGPSKKRKLQISPTSKKKSSKLPEFLDIASVQARFCRSITELQIAGLLRMPSKRCPDYLQRIAFGI